MVLVTKSKKPASIQHKKRTGQHHKQTRHYGKAYWPYLPLATLVVVGFLINLTWSHAGRSVLGYATDISVSALLSSTNDQRTTASEHGLQLNSQLNSAAQAKANDMVARNYWAHVTPDGKQPWWFITNAGYDYQAAGENLAYGFTTSSSTITGWMNSPEHRDNLLNASYQEVGFGIANAPNYQGTGPETIIVAIYGKPAVQVAVTTSPSPEPVSQHAVSTSTPTTAPVPAAPLDKSSTPASPTPTPPALSQPAVSQPHTAGTVKPKSVEISAKRVSRIQIIAIGMGTWSVFTITAATAIAGTLFLAHHLYYLRRVFVNGETFIMKHHLLDLMIISIAMLGALLSRTAGFIQ